MEKKIKIHEKFLYEIWKEQKFIKELSSKDGQKISIIDSGQENKELGGPDFKNARVKIGNITYCGDVEIDSFYSDWKNHGHNINKKYNKVILHAALNQDSGNSFVYTQEGRKVLSISLNEFLNEDLKSGVQDAITKERDHRINKMPCIELNAAVSKKEKMDYLFDLGISRFKKKCDRVLERLKEMTYVKELNLKEPVIKYELDETFHNRKFTYEDFKDAEIWKQVFYELLFEALGYSKNKKEFQKLASCAELSFIKTYHNQNDFLFLIEAILFNISGIIPQTDFPEDEDTLEYIKKLREIWNEVKLVYDGKTMRHEEWQIYKMRPSNFPSLRIAGGAHLLCRILKEDMISVIVNEVKHTTNIKKSINKIRSLIIVKSTGYWKKHYEFGKEVKSEFKYFIGLSRADEIITNIIIPFLSVYFEVFGDKANSRKALKMYINYYQTNDNNLVNEVSVTLNLNNSWKRCVIYQGMIELFREYCSRNKCLECRIGKVIFE
jgi:hypothetical protein